MSETEFDYSKIFLEIALKFFVGQDFNELTCDERIYFVLERAHWYLIDFYPEANSLSFGKFCDKFLTFLNLNSVKGLVYQFSMYKKKIHVYGALILSEDQSKILMVKGFHKLSKYTFPKGKIGFNETGKICAIREVYEEVGFDIKNNITNFFLKPEDEKYTLFLVPNISTKTKFCTKTRNEIKEIKWVDIEYLENQEVPEEFSHGKKIIKEVIDFLASVPYNVLNGNASFKFNKNQLQKTI